MSDSPNNFVTVGFLERQYRVPAWRVRRAVDSMTGIPRAGLYRLIPISMLPTLLEELERRGWRREADHAATI